MATYICTQKWYISTEDIIVVYSKWSVFSMYGSVKTGLNWLVGYYVVSLPLVTEVDATTVEPLYCGTPLLWNSYAMDHIMLL